MDMSKIELIVFDYDGTLVKAFTHNLLPGVKEWFSSHRNIQQRIAIANNFGGVGLRLWMETDNWGEPDRYPTEDETYERVGNTLMQLGLSVRNGDIKIYACFAYQASNGEWSPRPAGKEQAMEWQAENRKPNPGLLLQIMKDADVASDKVLLVGDDYDGEDRAISKRAGCQFINAREFFTSGTPYYSKFKSSDEYFYPDELKD